MSVFVCFCQSNEIFEQSNNIALDLQCAASEEALVSETRPVTRLPQSLADGQGPYFRPLEGEAISSKAKDLKKTKKVECNQRTRGLTDSRSKVKSQVARN